LSSKARIKRMRSFSKGSQSSTESQLPLLPSATTSERVWKASTAIESFIKRDLIQFSNNTIQVFQEIIKETSVQLQKAYLTTTEHAVLQ
jgi:hypothetical protein